MSVRVSNERIQRSRLDHNGIVARVQVELPRGRVDLGGNNDVFGIAENDRGAFLVDNHRAVRVRIQAEAVVGRR